MAKTPLNPTKEVNALRLGIDLSNLARRGIEFDLMPLSQRSGLPAMAYSEIEQGRRARHSPGASRSGRTR